MGKKTVTVTIDYELWKVAREKELNISGFFNECLGEYLKKSKKRKASIIKFKY